MAKKKKKPIKKKRPEDSPKHRDRPSKPKVVKTPEKPSLPKEKIDRAIPKRDTTSDLIFEIGLIISLFLLITAKPIIAAFELSILLAAAIVLMVIIVRKQSEKNMASFLRLCLSLIIMLLYSTLKDKEIKLLSLEDKTIFILFSSMIFLIVTSAFIIWYFKKREYILERDSMIFPILCAAGILVISAACLHLFINRSYQIGSVALTQILRQVLQHTILFVVLIFYMTTYKRARRVSLYITCCLIVLLILKV